MGETIKKSASTISELTGAQAVQAMLTLLISATMMILLIMGKEVPDFLLYAFFALIGLYMELPSKPKLP